MVSLLIFFVPPRIMPMMIANASTCSILPFTKDANGFEGIRFLSVSSTLVNSAASTSASAISMVTPEPIFSAFGRNRPRRLAKSVVPMKYSSAWPPTLPVADTLPIPLMPTTSEQNTSG